MTFEEQIMFKENWGKSLGNFPVLAGAFSVLHSLRPITYEQKYAIIDYTSQYNMIITTFPCRLTNA